MVITLENEGNVHLPVEVEIPLNGLKMRGAVYHMGGNLTTTGKVLKWRVELPPWSSRKADVGVIVPSIPERVEVQGKVTVYGHEEISVVTDDPRTNETGDPTLLTVSCEHGSQAEEREMNNVKQT